jgi:predicted metal-binding membrane protein
MTMPMLWMTMPGQSWLAAAASFVAAWVVMMAAMMLPSLVPMLGRYRHAMAGEGGPRLARLTAIVGAGYLFVWTVCGVVVFPIGVAVAAITGRQHALASAAPLAVGAVVLIAGVLQHSAWKARHLAFCRGERRHGRGLAADAVAAWRHGLCLGLHCCQSCACLTAVALVIGIMDLRVMAVVMVAITAERLAPSGALVARVTGGGMVGAGLFLIVQSAVLG